MRDGKAWVRVTYARDIPSREGRAVQVGSREIAIFNLGDRFLAIENRCPHKGGPLAEGITCGSAVVCPLHAWKFSLETGKGVSAASELSCVQTFPTRKHQKGWIGPRPHGASIRAPDYPIPIPSTVIPHVTIPSITRNYFRHYGRS